MLCFFLNLGGAGRRPLRGDVSPFKVSYIFPETRSQAEIIKGYYTATEEIVLRHFLTIA
ncbi:hypothetical protein ES707_17331 [subsurface metagenome]